MAKRSDRDRDRDAARNGAHGDDRAGRAHRRLARDLGRLEKRLNRARSQESKRLRQLDEAAADVVRLEAELRRLQAELAGATVARRAPEATPSSPRAVEDETGAANAAGPGAPHLAAQAAALQAELARLEAGRAVPSEPDVLAPMEVGETADLAEMPEPGEAAEAAGVAPAPGGREAEAAAAVEGEVAPSESPASTWSDWIATPEAGMPVAGMPVAGVAWEPAPDVGREAERGSGTDEITSEPPAASEGPAAEADIDTAVPGEERGETEGVVAEEEDARWAAPAGAAEDEGDSAARDWPSVIHLGAGSGIAATDAESSTTAPTEGLSEAGAAEADAPAVTPATGRREAVEAPEPTARSWPQRGHRRSGR